MSIENTFYSHMDQNADECIMSNAELHEFRGGDKIFAMQFAAGVGVALAGSCLLFRRTHEFTNFNLRGNF
jgi:hypothetical protein